MRQPTNRQLNELIEKLKVPPGAKVKLGRDYDPGFTAGWLRKRDGNAYLKQTVQRLSGYQERLAAEGARGVLVVFQGIDAAGKDGAIRHVMSGVNPQGVPVNSFKVPSHQELNHDFLWRYSVALPERGQIGIFNRSHYEEVLVVRVHPEHLDRQQIPADARRNIWARRYVDINAWERHLTASGFTIVKLFLNLSAEEQRTRFLKRIDRSDKNWKFSAADAHERRYWDDYQLAFSQMLSHTSTEWAPWYVIPADHKWFARIAVGAVIVQALMDLDPRFPTVSEDEKRALQDARAELIAEAPRGTAPDPFRAKSGSAQRPKA